MVQHVVDDDAHHLAAVRHHAERHAPDVAGMDDATVRHLDRHRSALAQRDESSAVAAAAGRRHAVPAPGIIGQCCIQRHCLLLGLRAGALGIGGHSHLLHRGTLRRERRRCSSRLGRRHRQSRGRSRAGSHRTDSRSLEGLCPRGRCGGCSSALLSYRGSISRGRAPTATSRPFQQRSTLLVGLLALHDVRVGPGARCTAARIRVDAARLARQRRAHALSSLRQAIVVALLIAAVRPRTSRSVGPLASMPAGTSTAGRSGPLAAASGVRSFGRVRANRCHVALLVAAEADALVLLASLVTGAAPATLVATALCPASVAGAARLLGGAVAATHGRHQCSAVRPLGAHALLVALVLVDEGRHLVPLDLVRLLQQIAQLEREHGRPVARLQPVEQHEGVLARRRLLLGVVQQRQDVIDARAVRVERLVVLLAQRHPLRQQLADVVLLGALQLRLQPVRQAVGEVLRHALSRLCAQLLRQRGPQRAVRLGRLLSEQADVLARGLLLVRQLGRACAVRCCCCCRCSLADADVRQVLRRLLAASTAPACPPWFASPWRSSRACARRRRRCARGTHPCPASTLRSSRRAASGPATARPRRRLRPSLPCRLRTRLGS